MSDQPRARGFGCLTLLSIFCLCVFTIGEGALVWYLNPNWFDRLAFWRGPILEPDLIVAQDAASRANKKSAFEKKQPPQPKAPEGKLTLLSTAEVSGQYEPGQGLTLKNPSNAELKLAPGAVAGAAKVTMTPVMHLPTKMGASLAGPVYEIRVGDQEHYQFQGEVTITLPYHPGSTDRPVIAVWENGSWKELASTVDRERKTATARVPHLSLLGVLTAPIGVGTGTAIGVTILAGGYFIYTSPTANAWWYGVGKQKETAHFIIHYTTEGEHAVVGDLAQTPWRNEGRNRQNAEHPLFVEKMAIWLEEAKTRLERLGVQLPAADHHHVFLLNLKGSNTTADLGETSLGGPMLLSTELWRAQESSEQVDPVGVIRATVAHEMCHVAQGRYFNLVNSRTQRWWIEMSAQYLGDRVWQPEFNYDTIRKYDLALMPEGGEDWFRTYRLPAFSLNAPYSVTTYCQALFLVWIDERYGAESSVRIIRDTYDRGDPSIESLDQAMQKVLQKPLADVFAEYAAEFYYRDLWTGTLAKKTHTGVTPKEQMLNQIARQLNPKYPLGFTEQVFAVLTEPGDRNDAALTTIRNLPHLASVPLYVHAGVLLPKARKGKLVVKIDQGAGDLRVSYAVDKIVDRTLPLHGSHNELKTLAINGQPLIIDNFGVVDGYNRATLLFVNPSLSQDAKTFEVRRWLLLAPSWMLAARQSAPGTGRNWKLAWHKAELKDYPETFKGYNLYRRKPGGEPVWALIKEDHTEEQWTDTTAPDDDDYVYGVRVKDVLGNLSEIKEQDNNDPWVGIWEGDARLIEGSIAKALRKGLKKITEDADRKEQERITRIENEQSRQQAQRTHENEKKARDEILGKMMELFDLAEQAARIGVPLQLKIRHSDGKYSLGITKVVWQDTGWKAGDDIELERVDMNTMKLKTKLPPEFPPFELRLRRTPSSGRNQIRGEWTLEVPDDPNHNRFRFSWDFSRNR